MQHVAFIPFSLSVGDSLVEMASFPCIACFPFTLIADAPLKEQTSGESRWSAEAMAASRPIDVHRVLFWLDGRGDRLRLLG